MATWTELEAAAPELARPARLRFTEARVALLGSIRADGAPRISPVEPYFFGGHLIFGSMGWSGKTRDLLRDSRCVLHSPVSSPDGREIEVKIHGDVSECDDRVREECREGWWIKLPPSSARIFTLDIREAVLVGWDPEGGRMEVKSWTPRTGYRMTSRAYP